MNKKAENYGMMYAIVMAIIIFIIGMVMLNYMIEMVDFSRDSVTGIDCNNSTISDGSKMTCLGITASVPYFIIIVLSVAGGYITFRLAR